MKKLIILFFIFSFLGGVTIAKTPQKRKANPNPVERVKSAVVHKKQTDAKAFGIKSSIKLRWISCEYVADMTANDAFQLINNEDYDYPEFSEHQRRALNRLAKEGSNEVIGYIYEAEYSFYNGLLNSRVGIIEKVYLDKQHKIIFTRSIDSWLDD
ncbi:MAG: hypothetical protein IJR20_05360 [Muribaculaceae bacterium]|nr:hypothetical protein [Muribaculaceae bacterium]